METKLKRKLLYIDDEPINLELFALTFKKFYDIVVAQSGEEGLSLLTKNKDIRLVISDMRMPKMDGLEFIQKAKELNHSRIFFLLSGYNLTEEIQSYINNGIVKAYFQKPLRREQILQTIDHSIAN